MMSVIFLLMGASILVAGGFLVAYLWAVRDGQFDDTYTPSVRILFDDEVAEESQITKKENPDKENQSKPNK